MLVDYQPASGFMLSRGASRFEISLVLVLAMAILIPGIWAYTLIDPWETHYAEVARRMLQDDDWVHTQWQNEGFRSKPVLTFWLMAAGMKVMGIGDGGGFSGEMTSSELVMLAVRLPFVLFGIMGVVMLWWMLARLVSRRVAWLSFLIVVTTPFFFLVARQAITDMPLVGCMMGAISCFALAVHSETGPLRPIWGRINAFHLFVAVFFLVIGWQAGYYAYYFAKHPVLAPGVRFPAPQLVLPLVMLVSLLGFAAWAGGWRWLMRGRAGDGPPAHTTRQVYMCWFYTLLGVSVLAKGLPVIGLAGIICFFYLLLTGEWRLLRELEIPRGVLICVIIAVPWHVGMWLKDGRPFLRDYFITHLFNRAFAGVHGERGTFDFFMSQLGVGMWPWVGLLPAAVAGVLSNVAGKTREGRVRLLIGVWAVVSVGFFAAVQTKFHHYILPAVPALAVLIAFWIDDLLAGRLRRVGLLCLAAAAIVLLITRDLMGEEKQLIEMFIYRYDRPWPSNEPWSVDLSDVFLGFGLVFALLFLAFAARTVRRLAFAGLGAAAMCFALWAMNVYMSYAGTHWGMRTAVNTYYQLRQIHGLDLYYYNERQVADEWEGYRGPYEIKTVIPEHLSPGQPMFMDIHLVGRTDAGSQLTLNGVVERIGDNRFWVRIPAAELGKLAPLIAKGKSMPRPAQQPWTQIDADRLIAWQLYWRGENFWSGDEIWGRTSDMQTAFKEVDNKAFLAYLKGQGREGQRYFIITEAGRASNLRTLLTTDNAKETYQILDRTSNKFTLLSFTL